jgi:RNA polymerase sigma factor (sigma-70 family)
MIKNPAPLPGESIEEMARLLEESSFGTPAARQLRDRAVRGTAAQIRCRAYFIASEAGRAWWMENQYDSDALRLKAADLASEEPEISLLCDRLADLHTIPKPRRPVPAELTAPVPGEQDDAPDTLSSPAGWQNFQDFYQVQLDPLTEILRARAGLPEDDARILIRRALAKAFDDWECVAALSDPREWVIGYALQRYRRHNLPDEDGSWVLGEDGPAATGCASGELSASPDNQCADVRVTGALAVAASRAALQEPCPEAIWLLAIRELLRQRDTSVLSGRVHISADEATERLYREHYGPLVRLALLLTRDFPAAEEIVQNSFVATHKEWPRLARYEKALSYLRQAVVNRARSVLKRKAITAQVEADPMGGRSPADDVAVGHGQSEVIAMLLTLPARQREALILRYYADLSAAEIAAVIGISPRAVKNHTRLAMTALRAALEDAPPGLAFALADPPSASFAPLPGAWTTGRSTTAVPDARATAFPGIRVQAGGDGGERKGGPHVLAMATPSADTLGASAIDVSEMICRFNAADEHLEDLYLRARRAAQAVARSRAALEQAGSAANRARLTAGTVRAEHPWRYVSLHRQGLLMLPAIVLGIGCYFSSQALSGSQNTALRFVLAAIFAIILAAGTALFGYYDPAANPMRRSLCAFVGGSAAAVGGLRYLASLGSGDSAPTAALEACLLTATTAGSLLAGYRFLKVTETPRAWRARHQARAESRRASAAREAAQHDMAEQERLVRAYVSRLRPALASAYPYDPPAAVEAAVRASISRKADTSLERPAEGSTADRPVLVSLPAAPEASAEESPAATARGRVSWAPWLAVATVIPGLGLAIAAGASLSPLLAAVISVSAAGTVAISFIAVLIVVGVRQEEVRQTLLRGHRPPTVSALFARHVLGAHSCLIPPGSVPGSPGEKDPGNRLPAMTAWAARDTVHAALYTPAGGEDHPQQGSDTAQLWAIT